MLLIPVVEDVKEEEGIMDLKLLLLILMLEEVMEAMLLLLKLIAEEASKEVVTE